MLRKVILIGHRGAAGYEPENTIRSVLKGFECGADYVEVDVRATKDGYLVAMHDETVDRTTNGKGLLREMTLEEVRKLDAGKGEKVPLIKEVLEVARDRGGVVLEIKEYGVEEKLLDLVYETGMTGRVIIVSFIEDSLRKVKELDKKMKVGLLFFKDPWSNIQKALEIGAEIVGPRYTLITRQFVERAHREGLRVFTWTVNDERTFVKVLDAGVDGVTTDYPCRFKQLVSGGGTLLNFMK